MHKILEIDENASLVDVKIAFRKLALKYHPDKSGDDVKFKQIVEAYKKLVLEKSNDFNQLHIDDFDLLALLNKYLFTPTIEKTMEYTLKELYFRTEKKLKIGNDKIISFNIDGSHQKIIPIIESEKVMLQLKLKLRLNDEKKYRILDNNLIFFINVDFVDSLGGFCYNYKHLDDEKYLLYYNDLITPNDMFELKNFGLLKDDGTRGNLILKINIIYPETLTQEIKDKIVKNFSVGPPEAPHILLKKIGA